jgi:DNA-binding MarR family transcriptional regulator
VIDEVLDGLEASGIVARGDDRFSLSLTDAGAAFFARGQAILAEITASLYGGMDPDELEIARRVLVEVTARAEARLVG